MVWKMVVCSKQKKHRFAVDCKNNKRMDQGPQFTRLVSPPSKINNLLGKRITARQLTNNECITMPIHGTMTTMRFEWALQQST